MREDDHIKEWRKNGDKMEWTGRYIKLLDGSESNWLFFGDDPLLYALEGGGHEVLPLTGADIMSLRDVQNALRTHDVASGSSEIKKTGDSEP